MKINWAEIHSPRPCLQVLITFTGPSPNQSLVVSSITISHSNPKVSHALNDMRRLRCGHKIVLHTWKPYYIYFNSKQKLYLRFTQLALSET